MANLADRPSIVVQYICDLVENNKLDLGIEDVFYGDQDLLPRTPAVCVEAAPFDRTLGGVGGKGRTDNLLRVRIIVYCGKVQDNQITRKESEELAEAVMDLLHEDVTMGGLVTHGFVRSIQSGYSARPDQMLRAANIDWQGQSKTQIV